MRPHELRFDLIEAHRRGIDDARAGRAVNEKLRRHERAGVETDRTARQQLAPAHRDEIGGAGACADEMHGHGAARSVFPRWKELSRHFSMKAVSVISTAFTPFAELANQRSQRP